jgi:hypothetical protein
MSVLLLKGTLFEKHIQAEQAHALYLARSADAHYAHLMKVLMLAVATQQYEDVLLIPTTQAPRHTIRTVQMAEAEYASYNIESPFVRAKNHMAKLANQYNGRYYSCGYVLSIMSDLDGTDYLFKLTKNIVLGACQKINQDAGDSYDGGYDNGYKDGYDGYQRRQGDNDDYASYTDMYERLV